MTSAPTDLSASAIIASIESGQYPRELVLNIARGFLPLSQEELISVLAYLTASGDTEISELARGSLHEIPSGALIDFASAEASQPEHLASLVGAVTDLAVLEALVRNQSVPDQAIIDLASRAGAQIQEIIVTNQARLIRAPGIIDALLENPAVSGEVRRRALENREEFFDKKARIEKDLLLLGDLVDVIEPDLQEISYEAIADLLEKASAEADSPPPPAPDAGAESKTTAIWAKVQFMTISEKVQLAFRGDKMVRMLLVRDRNKMVCTAVMRNPRMTESEAESIAGMRNVDEEVLRLLGMKRDYVSKYGILSALCRNPKAPIGVVLPLINRLTLRDLKSLKDDKGVSEAVRNNSKRFYLARVKKN